MSAEIPTPLAEVYAEVTPSEMIDAWSASVDRLNAAIDSGDVAQELPEWWYEETSQLRGIKDALSADTADPRDVSKYFTVFVREAEVKTKLGGWNADDLLGRMAYSLGSEVVTKGFRAEAEDGPMHTSMLDSLSKIIDLKQGSVTDELEIARDVYGFETITQLLGVKGGEFEKELHRLFADPEIIRSIRFLENQSDYEKPFSDIQASDRQWISSALEARMNISHEEAMDYSFSVSRKAENEEIADIIQKFDELGADRVRRITQATGIIGLEAYSVEQLLRMDEYATDFEKASEALSSHDVNVLMVNRVGDHNGVMRDVAAIFDDDTRRTLFFEIATSADIARYMATLHKRGIDPSTLVLAAHSLPGNFSVTDERLKDLPRQDVFTIAGKKLVASAVEKPAWSIAKEYALHDMKGVARLVEKYMQPSRAIDDDKDDSGRKKIIFVSCDVGTEVEQYDLDPSNQKIQIGVESVVSQLGKDLSKQGVESNVDIYGAPAGIQVARTANGVRYTGQPIDTVNGRTAQHATRIRLDDGTLTKSSVAEIPLRNSAIKQRG